LDELIVRSAVREDNKAIHTLIHSVHINPLNLDWRRFIVAEAPQGDFLGCGQMKKHSDGSLELASIAVKEKSRGRGVARAIILELLSEEVKRPIYLMCRTRLSLFYQKFGFHPIEFEEMPKYFHRIYRAEQIFNTRARSENRMMIMRLD
jgi:N-acetylglutamate synthase-like GNAT family acetyltransferase